jgi:hypothetical protein
MTKNHAQAAAAKAKALPKSAASANRDERAQVQKALFTKRSDPGKTGRMPPPKHAKPGDHAQSELKPTMLLVNMPSMRAMLV